MKLTKEQIQKILQNKPQGTSDLQILTEMTNQGFEFEGVDMNAARQFVASNQTQTPTPEPQKTFGEKATGVIQSIFPGKKIGEAIGTEIARATVPEEQKQFITQDVKPSQIAGDLLQIGAFFAPVGTVAKGLAVGGKALGLGAKTAQTLGNIGAGGLTGYTFDVGLGLSEDTEKPFTPGLGTLVGAGIPGAGVVARGGARLAGEIAGKTTGAGFGAIRQGLEATTQGGAKGKAFTSALRGQTTPESLVNEAKQGLQTIKQARTQEYVKQLEEISKNKTSLDISPIVEDVGNQLDKFGIEVTEQGLDFSRSPLRFNKQAQDDITTIVNEMKGFGLKAGDRTPIGVDSLKRAFDDLYTPSGEARAFVASVRDKARKVLSQVDGYDDLAKNYADRTEIINEIQKGLSLGDKASVETSFKKLTSALRTNNEYREQFIKELDEATGGELLSKIAGQQLSEIVPRGLSGVLTGAGGALGLASGVGVVPILFVALTTSPRLVGEIVTALGFTGRKANQVLQILEKNAGKLNFPGDVILNKAKNTPNKQGGFIKLPQLSEALDESTIAKTNTIKNSIPKSSPKSTTKSSLKGKGVIPETNLINEARKYKSAEEFVKAQKQKAPKTNGSPSMQPQQTEGRELLSTKVETFPSISKQKNPSSVSKSDYPLWFNKRNEFTWDSDSPVKFVSGERPTYKRHVNGYIGDIDEWSKDRITDFYDIFGGWKNIPKVKLDSAIEKSFYDSKNNLFITKKHNTKELNRAIENYVEKKSGISFKDYKKLPSKKPEIQKTNEEKLIKQLKTAQKYSDMAKTEDYNAGIVKRNIKQIENSGLMGRGAEESLSLWKKRLETIEKFYKTKQNQIENAIINSNKLGNKPIISLDESGIPVVYFETPKGQISFHIPNYGVDDFNKYDTVYDLIDFLPQKVMDSVELVDNYRWSGLKNTDEIIDSLEQGDFEKIGKTGLTQSQLEEIWNKANKATPESSLLQEAKKYKSAEEFVKDVSTSEIRYQLRGGLDKIAKETDVKSLTGKQKVGEETVTYWKKRIEENIMTPGNKGTEGFAPIIVDGNKIVDGFHKLQAYKELGFGKVPTISKSQLEAIWKKANNKK